MAEHDLSAKLDHKKRTVRDLADYIKTKSGLVPNYSLFLGAGASVTSGISSGIELVKEWRKEIYEKLSKESFISDEAAKTWLHDTARDWYEPLNEYSSLFEKKFDLPSQRRRFVEGQVDKKLPSIGYAYLVELFERRYFDTVFTTNFDDLINEAFYQFSAERPLLCAHDSSIKGISINSARPKIIKLHGDYLFDNIKSSLNETESLEVNTKEKLIEFTKEYGLIFIGYAGNDKSIMEVVNFLLKQDEYLKNGIYWCKRKNDIISPELYKFLLKDRVYLVEIDGFDELMAELFYQINISEGLSLGVDQKSTKRERIITGFIKDKFNLSENSYIHNDIKKLKKYSFTQDISALINDLSSDDLNENQIPEIDFKNLLSIDRLIKNKNFEQAEAELDKLINLSKEEYIKTKYISRILDIYEEKEQLDKALEQCDKLLKIDPYNISYCIRKSDFIKEFSDKIDYLKELNTRFPYNKDLKNKLAVESLSWFNSSSLFVDIAFSDIKSWLDDSLSIDKSLNNSAWTIMREFYINKYKDRIDKKECNKKIEELILEMKRINPIHTRYINASCNHVCSNKKYKEIKEKIDEIDEIYLTSSMRKQKFLLVNLTALYRRILDVDIEDEDRKEIEKQFDIFFSKYLNGKEKDAIAPLLMCKSEYAISYKKNIKESIDYALQAIEAQWAHDEIDEIYKILEISKGNDSIIDDLVINLPKSFPLVKKYKLLSSYYTRKKEFDEAKRYLELSYSKGLDYPSYLSSKSYILLCNEEYDVVISEINNNIERIKSYLDKDVLIINRELAKSKLGKNLKEPELRSVISHDKAKGSTSMCANFILGDGKEANRILDNMINKNYMNYFIFSSWPAVPKCAIDKYECLFDNDV